MMWRESSPAPEEIYDLLYRLGLAATSTAFFHLAYSVRLAVYQPQRLLAPERLYLETARHYRSDPRTVERNIRWLSVKAWKNAPEQLSQMAGVTLDDAPPPVQFLSILAAGLKGGHAA
ncbi:sporulation initiation factor Spo0A C-terminal domain-containing protein [uncultured Oscillibacter sp.]|uniref:sporulation initiation factor Spo0A C-terminal domain-containing protein n=1 Tax=uncultured Oscillibacter sp. TaxID=876091 RepID=UPI002624DC60|nr:sporulation initiation factor Spo0A C-terminal domain-containing protein [uncultured Oscillibacter sp.]